VLVDATYIGGAGTISAAGGAGLVRWRIRWRSTVIACVCQAGKLAGGAGGGGRVALINFVNATVSVSVAAGERVPPLMFAGA
jgi:hypothetical protein